jgi:hypothetical protein
MKLNLDTLSYADENTVPQEFSTLVNPVHLSRDSVVNTRPKVPTGLASKQNFHGCSRPFVGVDIVERPVGEKRSNAGARRKAIESILARSIVSATVHVPVVVETNGKNNFVSMIGFMPG